MQYNKKACMTFDAARFEAGTIVVGSQRHSNGAPVGNIEEVLVQWGEEDGNAQAAVHSISILTSKFGDIHQAYEYFQLAPVPGCNGLTAREVLRRRGADVLIGALEDLENLPLN
jgi:hypothetical protein